MNTRPAVGENVEERMAADALRPDQVHVWWVDLTRPPVDDGRCLDAAELVRARRFRQERHRQQYVASHCAFRHLAGHYLGCTAAEVRITRQCTHCGDPAHGKPAVAGPGGDGRVEVNASHADGLGAVALAWAPLVVGVDVERLRPGVDWSGILRQVESDPAPVDDQEAFDRWTRFEAVTKAAGLGLATRPSLRPGGAAAGWQAALVPGTAPTWQVRSLPAPEGYAAALAADRVPAAGVQMFTWTGQPPAD
jgi:4'-phosphopantetheinyl transferase